MNKISYLCLIKSKSLEIMSKLFVPSENLTHYNKFRVRAKKADINIPFKSYEMAMGKYNTLLRDKTISPDDITVEGYHVGTKEMHTIWYTFKGKQSKYAFYKLVM